MEMMKKSLLLFITLISMISCEEFLESRDKSSVLEDKLFTNREGFEEALYGIYEQFQILYLLIFPTLYIHSFA